MATNPIFDGINYKFWRVKMRTQFLSMDLWDTVLDGYDDETNKEKQQKDAATLSYIQQGGSDRIFPRIKNATKAKQAWDILSVQFHTEVITNGLNFIYNHFYFWLIFILAHQNFRLNFFTPYG